MKRYQHGSHFGAFTAVVDGGRIVGVEPFDKDPKPSPLIDAIPSAVHAENRIRQPMVRAGWLEPGHRREKRGADEFIPVSWERAFALVAGEVSRVRSDFGNASIFAGSYGWASAGRFHHAKSQLKRFFGLVGGFTDQTGTYSNAAGHVILPHVLGSKTIARGPFTSWDSVAEQTDLFVTFGGLGFKNTQVEPGGMGEHTTHAWIPIIRDAQVEFVSITPLRDDTAEDLNAEWWAIRPNSDVALMLGIAHYLIENERHDRTFLDRCCVGFEAFADYVMGRTDGVVKSPSWASERCGFEAASIASLAQRMAAGRTMIGVAYALQRAEHGEQTYWMAITLAAMLGQIGLPGGGFGCGYGSMNGYGNAYGALPIPSFPIPANPCDSVIPVARISDMMLNPGGPYAFNGEDKTYPDTRMVYWAGGNPFHHHQDLNRLVQAWRQPETIVVNEIWWNATAKYADIVLPATTTLERNDIGASGRDRFVLAMKKAIEPIGESRSDFEIFGGLARELGVEEPFSEGRNEFEWLEHIYQVAHQKAAQTGHDMPQFDEFWRTGYVEFPKAEAPFVLYEAFAKAPDQNPIATPSGKIEIFSQTIESFDYDDCRAHPMWFEPTEWLGGARAKDYPLHLISNQPQSRLHGQMDNAAVSGATKGKGREPVRIHPRDAKSRGIESGDVVRVFNDRGACLAYAQVSSDIRESVIQLSTGAWFDPIDSTEPGTLELHGNPNVLTLDCGTSKLAQGPSAHSALVECERYDGDLPELTAFAPPRIQHSSNTEYFE